MIKKAMRFVGKKSAVATALMMGAIASAHAELPAAVTAATTEAVSDVKEAGGLILGVVVVIAAVSWVRRVVR